VTRFVYATASTLTGQLADEDHSLDWLFAVDQEGTEAGAAHERFMDDVGVIVEGSSTYEWVLRTEHLVEQPEKWTQYFGTRPTFVFTSRDLPVVPGADIRFVRGPVAEHLPAIRAAAGESGRGTVWLCGGGDLVGQFYDAGALDRIDVGIAPVTLPGGPPLLPRRIESSRLTLVSAEKKGQLITAVYEVRPAPSEVSDET